MAERILRVGDTVMWRGGFGRDPEKLAKIEQIDLCSGPHEKYGVPVEQVKESQVRSCCVTLDNGHWAYGDQLRLIAQVEAKAA